MTDRLDAFPVRHLQVVGAVMVRDGLIFCTRRGPGQLAGMWEFPGGKIEPGETGPTALAREVSEELGCTITVGDEIVTATHAYDFATVTMTTHLCEITAGSPTLSEHSEGVWLSPDQLESLDWAPLDLPTVARLHCRGLPPQGIYLQGRSSSNRDGQKFQSD